MATKLSTRSLSLKSAENYIDTFTANTNDVEIQYVFVGDAIGTANNQAVTTIENSKFDSDDALSRMIGMKRVQGGDLSLVIPRVDWESGKIYQQFDSTVPTETLVSNNSVGDLTRKPMYVITSDRGVYKCLSNNSNGLSTSDTTSTVEPSGDFNTSNGVISTADGYMWKYMYTIRDNNKFIDSSFMPVATRNVDDMSANTVYGNFNLNNIGVKEGELTTIVLNNGGSLYRDLSNVPFTPFAVGETTLTLQTWYLTDPGSGALAVASNVLSANMSITGNGIAADTIITDVYNGNNNVRISKAAVTSSFAANSTLFTSKTRIFIDGDGTGALANATVNTTGKIDKIIIDTVGSGYTRANARVFGTGSGESTRTILSPYFGHGFNIGQDLGANSIMVHAKIGELDATEGNTIPTGITFRQTGLIRKPYKYGSNNTSSSANNATANGAAKQATTLTLGTGISFTDNEFVYQGTSNTVFKASAQVLRTVSLNTIEVTKVVGDFVVNEALVGDSSGASRTITSRTDPEFQPKSMELLFVENSTPTTRTQSQAEDVRLVLQF